VTTATSDCVSRVLERLPSAKRSGDGWSALCPAHDDHKPSLDIDQGDDGRALICCRAGCSGDDVVAALGLRWSDLMPSADACNGSSKPALPLYGVEKLPVHPSRPVMLVQGRQAMEAAQAIADGREDQDTRYVVVGLSASDGVNLRPLHGREVLLWPAGGKAAAMEKVGRRLLPHCEKVRVLDVADVADGWDAADALDDGWGWSDLLAWAKPRPIEREAEPAKQPSDHTAASGPAKRDKLGEIVATYDYTDERGELLFQVTRHDPKDFRQRRPDGQGGWAWGLRDTRRVLYRLPGIISATADTFVWITEGEKDADRLAGEGLVATTCPMGAGKWGKVEDDALRGRAVVILPDHDAAGQKHADQVANALHPKAASVRVLHLPDLPDKGDVSDWLDAGHDTEELVRLAEACPVWTPVAEHQDHGAGPEDAEVRHEPEAGNATDSNKRPGVSNITPGTTINENGETKETKTARAPGEIAAEIFERVGPVYALGNRGLFTPHGESVRFLPNDAALFAWLKQAARVYWATRSTDGGSVVNRAELVAHLEACPADRFDDLAILPHHPRVPGTFYTGPRLPEPNPARLTEFMDHLNPEAAVDRALLEAALLTPGWGGPCGARPAFVLASDHGRGSGKTVTAETIASVWGGSIDCNVSSRDGIDRLRQRLLHDDKATRRAVLMDNLKGTTNSAEIESLITASEIQGHKLYAGDASRPNRLAWFISANKPHMSRDLADRSVIIRIGKPKRANFKAWASSFLDQHRLELVATLISRLSGPALCSIPADCRDRWTAWQDAVLSRVRGGDAAAAAIIERRPSVDADAEDWDEIEGEIRSLVNAAGHDPDRESVAMPLNVLAIRLSEATGIRFTPKGLASRLGEFAGVEGAEQFTKNPSRKHGRTWLWTPIASAPQASPGGRVEYPDWDRINPRTLEKASPIW